MCAAPPRSPMFSEAPFLSVSGSGRVVSIHYSAGPATSHQPPARVTGHSSAEKKIYLVWKKYFTKHWNLLPWPLSLVYWNSIDQLEQTLMIQFYVRRVYFWNYFSVFSFLFVPSMTGLADISAVSSCHCLDNQSGTYSQSSRAEERKDCAAS